MPECLAMEKTSNLYKLLEDSFRMFIVTVSKSTNMSEKKS